MTKLRKLNLNEIACAAGGFSLALKVVGIFGCVDNEKNGKDQLGLH